MSRDHDPYWKLRPPPPPSGDELCSCSGSPPVMLRPHLSANPLSCIACNLEVAPERIGFPEALAEELAFWQRFHDSFDNLWLDSGEFESWAKAELSRPDSPVNRRGLALASKLGVFRRTYYWWFQDSGADDFQPMTRCPACQGELSEQHGRNTCERCSIVIGDHRSASSR